MHDKYDLVALNRTEVPGIECHQADISDLEAIRPAFEGVDVVLHLAPFAASDASWDDVLKHNVIGTYSVFEAAREANVKRVVFASSGAVTSNVELESPYQELVAGPDQPLPADWTQLDHLSPVRPTEFYGCSKVFGEALGRHYSDRFGLSVICVRIGAVRSDDRPTQPRHYSIWCSHRDITQMLEKCIAAPEELRYDVFYAVSNNPRNYRSWKHGQEVLGFVPQDNADLVS